MSFQSQQANMRRLAELLRHDLSYVWGERENGSNGDKKTFLNVGKTFLRALGKDLGLREVKVTANAGGIAVSGECCLSGMWGSSGLYICIQQPCSMGENVLLYRTIRNSRDYRGGYNNFVSRRELARIDYAELLRRLLSQKKRMTYERAA